MTSSVSSPAQVSGTDHNFQSSTTSSAKDALGGKEVFLQLLVSQIKNQDPLNPMDSMNFVTQLAQFSQLEAILGMRSDLQSVLQSKITSGPSTSATAQP